MIALLVATAIFAVAAAGLLAWARQDYAKAGTLTWRSAIGAWMLYLFHADTVATAAFMDVAIVPVPEAPALVAGIAIGVTGFALFAAAVVALVRRGGFDGLTATRLVTDGVFRLSRHPQNLGWGLLLLGFAIGSRSAIGLLLVVLFAVFADRYARLEEQHLRDRFGSAYAQYQRAVPAYVGRPFMAI